MNKKSAFANILALLSNMVLVYACYMLCRIVFFLVNYDLFKDTVDLKYFLSLMGAGLIFDTSAILYSNILFVLLFLLPLHWKECPGFYKVVRWLFTIVNGICLTSNLIDSVYFQFTGRRTTMSVFEEFRNEQGGEIASVFFNEMITYWYLLLLAIVFFVLLYKLFRAPRPLPVFHIWTYYISQTVFLLLVAPFAVFGMRGGMTTATRPITISNANQYVDRPLEAGIVLNTPFSIFRTFGKKPFIVPDYMSNEEASRLYSPLHLPADSVQFKPMNVVVIILESFSKQHSGALNPDLDNGNYKGYTPFIDSLLPKSLTFEYSYSNGRKSIDGMPSILSSIPSFVEPFFLTPASLNDLPGIAGELTKHKGYHSAFFHGAMNGSMGFQAFARATGFQEYYGRTEYNEDPNYHGDADFDGTWAIWDEEFLQYYCDRMTEFKQPFVTSVFTASSHPPFAMPERYKGQFAQGSSPLYQVVAYTDHALKLFFEKAEKQPWFKNTLFVITADHTGGNEYPTYLTDLGYYSVPIIFYAPGMPELRGMDRSKVVNQIDIMPTILGILGYDRPYKAFGQDVIHTPDAETFAVNYIPSGGIYQLVEGDYLIQFDGKNVLKAYLYRTDKLLENDVKTIMPQDLLNRMEQRLKSIVQQYMQGMNSNNLVYRENE